MKTPAIIRALTDSDFELEYGFEPPYPLTGLIMIDSEGDSLGISGAVSHDGIVWAFSRITPKGRKYPVNIVEMGKASRAMLNSFEDPVYAIASKDEKNAAGFMQFIGYKFAMNIDGQDYYKWEKSHG